MVILPASRWGTWLIPTISRAATGSHSLTGWGASERLPAADEAREHLMSEEFDYIVVGAGSAGCVVANRLSQSRSSRVCVLEAGPSDRTPFTALRVNTPPGNTTLLNSPRFNWGYRWKGGERLGGRMIPCPRGRISGGTSAVNGMVYIRGHRQDYDEWAALGNRGWAYADVLPYFKKHENHEVGGDTRYHGRGGELNVAPLRHLNPISRAFIEAAH